MIRPILIHPDPRLKKVCEPVADIDDGLRVLMDDMLQTMYDAPGIGLVNPEILEAADELNEHEEGCLSIPEIFANVTRPAAVRVRYLDRDGELQERDFEGIRATCVQHEIDHLNGKLFIDYLSSIKRQMITSKMKKLKRERARERADAG